MMRVLAKGQITIGPAEMPHAGDELFRTKAGLNPFINFAATGAGHVWDFDNLTAAQQESKDYVSVGSTNFVYGIAYADIFFNPNRANHATAGVDIPFNEMLPIEDPYSFYHRSATEYKKVGFGVEIEGIPVPVIFEHHDLIYPLPLNYGQWHSSYSNYTIDVPTLAYYGYQQVRHLEVDGWGSITTPAGTFDVLRVKTRVEAHDSIMVDQLGTGFGIDRPTMREYKWLAQGIRVPVLQINTMEVFGTEIVTEIYFYDEERTLQIAPPIAANLCPGAQVSVAYDATGVFNSGGFLQQANIFRAQLSDANGSFANPVNIGQVTSTASGTITATIPANTAPGTGYRIRVVSTNPAFVGDDNGFDIGIGAPPVAEVMAMGDLEFCSGGSVSLHSTEMPGVTHQWMLNNEPIADANSATFVADASGEYSVMITSGCGDSTSDPIVVIVNEAPIHTLDQIGFNSCNGSPVNLVATNESGSIENEYQWFLNGELIEGAITNELMASVSGDYHLVINAANGCSHTTGTVSVSIEEATMPLINASGETSFCEDGMVTLTADAIEGSSIQWHLNGSPIDGANGSELMVMEGGQYTATSTTAGGCVSEASMAIDVTVTAVPEAASITAADLTTFCEGGSVMLIADPIEGMTYTWMNDGTEVQSGENATFMANTAGNYTVILNSNGCDSEASNSIEVIVNEAPIVPQITASGATSFCEGGEVILSVEVADGDEIQWTQSIGVLPGENGTILNVTESGVYGVIITNAAGCVTTSGSNPMTVEVTAYPAVPTITVVNEMLVTDVTGDIQWYLNDEPIEGATGSSLEITENGLYTVTSTINGCSSTSEEYPMLNVGIRVKESASFSIYPNPSNGQFWIEMDRTGSEFSIIDATGRMIHNGRISATITRIDLQDQQAGMYFLQIGNGSEKQVARIVLN